MSELQLGDAIWVTVSKADGNLHRRWVAQIEHIADDLLVLVARAGTEITSANGVHQQRYHIRTHYWLGRRYNLSEFYHNPDCSLALLYSDIIGPLTLEENRLSFVDHELDVAFWTGESAAIVDEDEFAEAVVQYGYSTELQQQCRDAAEEALQLVLGWRPAGIVEAVSRQS